MDPIEKLTAGFRAFRDGRFRQQRATYEALVDQGQRPGVAVVACSDSRVDPAIVLQADPGDLFVVRNVANLVPPFEQEGSFHGTSAALEYAVEHLQVVDLADIEYFLDAWLLLSRENVRVETRVPGLQKEGTVGRDLDAGAQAAILDAESLRVRRCRNLAEVVSRMRGEVQAQRVTLEGSTR